METIKGRPRNTQRDFKLKDAVFVFSSFTFVCFAVIFALLVYDVLSIQELFSFAKPIQSLLIAVTASLALVGYGIILSSMIPATSIDETNKTYQDNSLPAIFVFMFIGALFEETLFRGIIQNLFFLFTGHQWVSILLTALLFMAFHIQYFKKPIMLLNIFIPSLVFGWLYFKTNNILVPIAVHFVLNVSITLLFKYNLVSMKGMSPD